MEIKEERENGHFEYWRFTANGFGHGIQTSSPHSSGGTFFSLEDLEYDEYVHRLYQHLPPGYDLSKFYTVLSDTISKDIHSYSKRRFIRVFNERAERYKNYTYEKPTRSITAPLVKKRKTDVSQPWKRTKPKAPPTEKENDFYKKVFSLIESEDHLQNLLTTYNQVTKDIYLATSHSEILGDLMLCYLPKSISAETAFLYGSIALHVEIDIWSDDLESKEVILNKMTKLSSSHLEYFVQILKKWMEGRKSYSIELSSLTTFYNTALRQMDTELKKRTLVDSIGYFKNHVRILREEYPDINPDADKMIYKFKSIPHRGNGYLWEEDENYVYCGFTGS